MAKAAAESVRVLTESCSDPGQSPSAAGCVMLTLQPDHSSHPGLGLIGEILLRPAQLAAQPPNLLAVDDGGPPAATAPATGVNWT
jgi:hypothetical protein